MKKNVLILFITVPILAVICACAFSRRFVNPAPPPLATLSATASGCPGTIQVGFRIAQFGGVKAAVWYPSASFETSYVYSPEISSSVARDGQPLQGCGKFPLVIFSHGLGGCGTQSIFFTETLARHGYVVVAPDHPDAAVCHVDGVYSLFLNATGPRFLKPETWSDTSYQDRREDVETVLDSVLQDSQLQSLINPDEIGIAGHSLGGYTALGMVGGWSSWKDDRFKAALLFSPYSLPFITQNRLAEITVPLMYQGAQGDKGITPFLEGSDGAYNHSKAPKYFVKLYGGSHFSWTNFVCAKILSIATCLQSSPEARLIIEYGIAFFDQYLKDIPQPILTEANNALAEFLYQP